MPRPVATLASLLTLLVTPAVAGAASDPASAPEVEAAAARIDRATLAATTRFLASDLLEGRGPGSRGDALARAYLAAELEAAGLEPGGPDGTWEQRFEMVGLQTRAPKTWAFASPAGRVELDWWNDWIGASGVQAPVAEIAGAELVFAGYGIQAPEHSWDDFKGADLRGKVVVLLNDDPDWDPTLFAGKARLYYGRWTYKYESAARQGAAGAIIVHTTPSAGYPWQVVQTSWSGEQFELPAKDEPRIQLASWVTEDAARRLFALAGQDLDRLTAAARSRDFRPVPLGITTSIRVDVDLHRVETGNVLGRLRGSDPLLADQVVVYSSHHDHLGVGVADREGDTIYNGALDNATGCAQLVALARAFAALPTPPRRSILFALVAAEEQGLLGSEYFADHPTVPPGKIAANVNVDSANIYGRTKDLTFVGYGKSSLDAVVDRVAARLGRTVHPDATPEKGSFYRSDQFSFARIGVPAFYLDPGSDFVGEGAVEAKKRQQAYESSCYHQPCDEIADDWSYDGMIEDTRLAFEVGLEIANADEMPRWNPGDEFEAARKGALEAIALGRH